MDEDRWAKGMGGLDRNDRQKGDGKGKGGNRKGKVKKSGTHEVDIHIVILLAGDRHGMHLAGIQRAGRVQWDLEDSVLRVAVEFIGGPSIQGYRVFA